jgi:hypothetical protein
VADHLSVAHGNNGQPADGQPKAFDKPNIPKMYTSIAGCSLVVLKGAFAGDCYAVK